MVGTLPVTFDEADQPAVVKGDTAAGGVPANSTPVEVGGIAAVAAPTWMEGVRTWFSFNLKGALRIVIMGANGNSEVAGGVVSRAMSLAANRLGVHSAMLKFNGTSFDPVTKPSVAERLATSAAATNVKLFKTGATEVQRIIGRSARASVCYLRLFNKVTVAIPGTDTPSLIIPIPPTDNFNIPLDDFYFPLGASYAFTTGATDTDATAIAAGDILGLNIIYT